MKVYKNDSITPEKMNELLKEAQQEKPVMNLKEVENIIATKQYTPTFIKPFRIGINTIIVGSGIIVSSFLAYMTLKVDKQNETFTQSSQIASKPDNNFVEHVTN